MNILKASYEILTPISENGIEELKHIERIGRECYKSNDKITEDGSSAKKFVKMLIDRGHEAMIEHCSLSVYFTVDRGITHEQVRHRIASFAQESTRYVNYSLDKFGNEINVIDISEGIRLDKKMRNLDARTIDRIFSEWYDAMADAERHYMRMIELGASAQIARGVLPTSTKAGITITANYREWRHFFELRTPDDAHPQMREITIPLLAELKSKLPIIFDDIEVDAPKKDMVEVCRCKDCKYYLTLEEAKNDFIYKDYPFDAAEAINAPGLCTDTDKWSEENWFCSCGVKKKAED